jgi:UDP-N-acetylmuramoylalanine--D-glutamate ligase
MDLKQSPNVAVLTNIFPHHLDDAGSYQNYIEIKKNIYRFQNAGDTAIVNRSLVESGIVKESEEMGGELALYGGEELKASYGDREVRIPLSEFRLSGEHNIQNANAAMLAGLACGLPILAIEEGVKTFCGLRYRRNSSANTEA